MVVIKLVEGTLMKPILIFTLLLMMACSSTRFDHAGKLDLPLKQKLSEVEKGKSGELIQFVGKCDSPISGEMRSALEESGVVIHSVVNDIFTASGTPEQIRRLAAYDQVVQLQLSVERKF